jgi:hypothetical protein
VEEHRLAGLLARRQYGKTTVASHVSLKKMMDRPGHTVVFGSVKLDLGREIVRKEAEAMQKAIRGLVDQARAAELQLDAIDTENRKRGQKENVLNLSADDFAELYEAQRLEFRLHHSSTVYSRTKVVALTPAAVGETGDLILDEVGRVKNFREVWEAVKPIIASNPEFRCMLTTTPPPDDGHFSFELLAPPIDAKFPPNPKGNWYRSELGIWVLRIDAWDAYADGVPLYDDDTGAPMSPEVARPRNTTSKPGIGITGWRLPSAARPQSGCCNSTAPCGAGSGRARAWSLIRFGFRTGLGIYRSHLGERDGGDRH